MREVNLRPTDTAMQVIVDEYGNVGLSFGELEDNEIYKIKDTIVRDRKIVQMIESEIKHYADRVNEWEVKLSTIPYDDKNERSRGFNAIGKFTHKILELQQLLQAGKP